MPKSAAPTSAQLGRLAVIPISGVIDRNLSAMDALCTGACDINNVMDAMRAADADASIDTIITTYDTPGGSVSGIPEAAALWQDIGTRKKTGAYIAGMCCSGGVYIASQSNVVVCELSSVVGSIGVISGRTDATGALEKAGIKMHVISRGPRKADGHPATEMDEDELAAKTAIVDQIYGMFTGAVRSARPQVSDEAMESGVYIGQRAVDAGLVDGLCSSLDEFAAELLSA